MSSNESHNILQKIYWGCFASFSWAPKLRSLLYPYYLCYKILFKKNNENNLPTSIIQRQSFQMVWYVENLITDEHKDLLPQDNISLNNCILIGNSRFIIHKDKVSLPLSKNCNVKIHELYKEYYFQEEFLQIAKYINKNENENEIEICVPKPVVSLKNKWVSVLHPTPENWMHFIAECLPIVDKAFTHTTNIGVICNNNMPETAKQMLSIVCPKTPIVEINYGSSVNVEELILPACDVSTSCGFWSRDESFKPGFFAYDKEALLSIRKKVLSFYSQIPDGNKKIYINRKSHFRNIVNNIELKELLINNDFLVIEPGGLTLEEQVKYFSQAKLLIAQAGAALANMIFMPSGAKIICLRADNKWATSSDYFYEYAKIFDLNFEYICGKVDNDKLYSDSEIYSVYHPMNANFSVSLDEIKNCVIS